MPGRLPRRWRLPPGVPVLGAAAVCRPSGDVEKFAALLEASKAELTAVIGAETGKPRWEAAGEVTAMINKVAISVKAYHVRTGEQHSDLPDGAPRCVTGRTAYWRCLAPITFPAICRTAHRAGAVGGQYRGL